MDIDGYLFHLKARNLAPSTIKAAGEFLRPFERVNDPLNATKIEIQNYLGVMFDRCKPSTVWTAWRHLKGFYAWLEVEGDIEINPMNGVARPVVPAVDIPVLQSNEIAALLATCSTQPRRRGRNPNTSGIRKRPKMANSCPREPLLPSTHAMDPSSRRNQRTTVGGNTRATRSHRDAKDDSTARPTSRTESASTHASSHIC